MWRGGTSPAAGNRRARQVDRNRARRRAPRRVRAAALRALSELEPATLQPVLDALANDPRQQVREAVDAWGGLQGAGRGEVSDWLEHPESSPLPDEPETVRRHVSFSGDSLSLAGLHRLMEAIRQREEATEGQRRREWMGARATVHVALARRGSRLGIYDLREALEAAAEPLPVEFLAAVKVIGDASCLEPLAAAYFKTGRRGRNWFRLVAPASLGSIPGHRRPRGRDPSPCPRQEN